MNFFVSKLRDVWSLLVGLAITGKYICSRRKTVHYPRQVVDPELTKTFRGPIELIGLDNDPGTPRCISCMMCVQACPSGCISVTRQSPPKPTPEEAKAIAEAEARGEKVKKPAASKNPAVWTYDYTKCSLCGCCVEACPADSIKFSNEIYVAGTSRSDFHYNLLARLARKAAANGSDPATDKAPAKGSEPAIDKVPANGSASAAGQKPVEGSATATGQAPATGKDLAEDKASATDKASAKGKEASV